MWLAEGRGTGGKVICMAERRGIVAEHPALAQLRAYWEGLRAGGTLPTRSMIDPRGIEDALEYAFIAERIAPGLARVRLAGMHLNDLLGMEVRGMPLSAFFEPAAREPLAGHVEAAFAGPAAVSLTLESAGGFGRAALSARLILLPLRDEGGKVTRVLGGLAAEGGTGRTPRRFRLVGAQSLPCGDRDLVPDAPAPRDADQVPGLAEPSAPFAGPKGAHAPRAAGHLRLVHSSK